MMSSAKSVGGGREGLKVGGHQASSASVVTLMTALYLDVLRPADRIAVKPHASPVYHAIQYLLGRQSLDKLKAFRALGGAQSYPSRTKDGEDVDFSTDFAGLEGGALREWIDACPNSLYSALVFKGGEGWRRHLDGDLGHLPGIRAFLDAHDDQRLHAVMTNLAGHDMQTVLEAFHAIDDDLPTSFIAYTIKGFGLPFAGHKDNHAGLINEEQLPTFQRAMTVPAGDEWERFAALPASAEAVERFLAAVPFPAQRRRRLAPAAGPVPDALPLPQGARLSAPEGFRRVLNDLAGGDSELARRIVTCSPDVTVSTNLRGWVNHPGVFDPRRPADVFRDGKVISAQRWQMSPQGPHIQLGIA